MIDGKISYSQQSVLYIYDLRNKVVTSFNDMPLMRAPAWHPDGIHLAYGVDKVYRLNTLTGAIEQLSQATEHAIYPAWRPDGQSIIYMVDDKNESGRLCLRALSTGQETYLSFGFRSFQPTFHPDGQTIAFVGLKNEEKHLYKANLSCLENNDCAESVQQLTTIGRFNHAPAWSPDGEWLAFERYIEPEGYWAIMLIDANGQQTKQITPDSINAHHPTWSKDGNYLAFEQKNETGPSHICAIRPDGSDYTVLIEDGGLEPDWY